MFNVSLPYLHIYSDLAPFASITSVSIAIQMIKKYMSAQVERINKTCLLMQRNIQRYKRKKKQQNNE